MNGRQTELPGNEVAVPAEGAPSSSAAAPAGHEVPHRHRAWPRTASRLCARPSCCSLLLWRVCVCYMTIEGAISQLPGILATAASPEKACSSWSGDDSAAWSLWPLADPWQGLQPKFWLPCLGHCFLAGTSRWIPGSCWPWHSKATKN